MYEFKLEDVEIPESIREEARRIGFRGYIEVAKKDVVTGEVQIHEQPMKSFVMAFTDLMAAQIASGVAPYTLLDVSGISTSIHTSGKNLTTFQFHGLSGIAIRGIVVGRSGVAVTGSDCRLGGVWKGGAAASGVVNYAAMTYSGLITSSNNLATSFTTSRVITNFSGAKAINEVAVYARGNNNDDFCICRDVLGATFNLTNSGDTITVTYKFMVVV